MIGLGRMASLFGFIVMGIFCLLFISVNKIFNPPLTEVQAQETRNVMWVAANSTKTVAEGNMYNAIATTTIKQGDADLIVALANATAIVANSPQGPLNAYSQGQSNVGTWMVWLIGIGGAALVLGSRLR